MSMSPDCQSYSLDAHKLIAIAHLNCTLDVPCIKHLMINSPLTDVSDSKL